jgi:hypothetical protein
LKVTQTRLLGHEKGSFKKISAFLTRLVQTNSTTYYRLEAKDGSFYRLIVAAGSMVNVFGYRKMQLIA